MWQSVGFDASREHYVNVILTRMAGFKSVDIMLSADSQHSCFYVFTIFSDFKREVNRIGCYRWPAPSDHSTQLPVLQSSSRGFILMKPVLPSDMASIISSQHKTHGYWIGTSATQTSTMRCGTGTYLPLLHRSFKIAEGSHRGFHSILSCSNPTLWKFLDALKAEQALTYVKLTRRQLRKPPEPRAPKCSSGSSKTRSFRTPWSSFFLTRMS